MTKWILAAALVGGPMASQSIMRAQDARQTQASESTQIEEIYLARSVPESWSPPTDFCAQGRIGFGGTRGEGRFTFRSTATQAADGRMSDTSVKTIGSIHTCSGARTANPGIDNFYAEGVLGTIPFRGIGKCSVGKNDFPERGVLAFSCLLDLSGLPSPYVGGLLTTNSVFLTSSMLGLESDPPGYTQNSIATIRLWRKRDAPSKALAQTKESLVGTWKFVSSTGVNDKGEVVHPAGNDPTGFLTYTADGRFSVIMADTERTITPPNSNEEKAKAFDTFHAYAGTYAFTGDQVFHHIEAAWYQILVGTDQVRSVTLDGDRLTLRGGFLVNGVMYNGNSELVWERLKPKTADK